MNRFPLIFFQSSIKEKLLSLVFVFLITNNNYHSIIANKIDTRDLSVNAGGSTGKYDARQVIVVAGNFSLDGEIVNIAQYEISSGM